MRRVFVSTACLPGQESLDQRLGRYEDQGLDAVELGGGVLVQPADLASLVKRPQSFLVHNYFPPPAEPFVVNLASAEGHPASVMDMSFANQALCSEYVAKNHKKLDNKVYSVPPDIDHMIAKLKLHALGVKIDTLTQEQKKYLTSWELGT